MFVRTVRLFIAGTAAVLALSAGAAHASDNDIFGRCDGLGKPGRSVDGIGSPVSTLSFGAFNSNSPAAKIDACNQALAHPKLLPTQQVRRARLLRARAVARLKEEKLAEALADLDQAAAAVTGPTPDLLYQRSMGVSLELLRGLIYDRLGNRDAALRLIRAGMAQRPYASEVQRVAAHLLMLDGAQEPDDLAAIHRAGLLDPSFAQYQTVIFGITGDLKAMARLPSPPLDRIAAEGDKQAEGTAIAALLQGRTQMLGALQLAYARAATGDVPGARRDLAAVLALGDRLGSVKTMMSAQSQAEMLKPLSELIKLHEIRIKARIALQEGRKDEATALVSEARLPMDALTMDLIKQLNAANGRPMVGGFDEMLAERQNQARAALFDDMIESALIEPETPGMASIYKRSRPNVLGALVGAALSFGTTLVDGIKNTDGFSATPNPDGTLLVSLIGATNSSAIVREAVLLRAAELALAGQKTAFVILDRNDYQRTWNTSQYGSTISSVPSGYKSDIQVRLLEKAEDEPRAIDARAVVDALGPYFYRDKT